EEGTTPRTPTPRSSILNRMPSMPLPTDNVAVRVPFYLLAIFGPYKGKKFQLNNRETRIGRDVKLNDIIIRLDKNGNVDPSISRRHATVTFKDGHFYISDKRSKTRTYVNQYKLSETDLHPLQPGDEIEIVSDQQSTIFRVCSEKNFDFSPPKRAGVWWVRYQWPVLRGVSALLLILAIIISGKALKERSVLVQKPAILELKESLWHKSVAGDPESTMLIEEGNENFNNSPVVADFNGDGSLDVAFLDLNGNLRAISGTDHQPLWETDAYVKAQRPGQLLIADVNSDQLSDILIMTPTERVLAIDGRLGIEIWNSPIIGGQFSGLPTVADVNGDNRMDVAISTTNGKLLIALGDLHEPQWQNYQINDQIHATISAADITGDGIDDFIIGTESGRIFVYSGKTKSVSALVDINLEIEEMLGPQIKVDAIRTPIATGNLNKDRRLDLIVSTNNGNLITINGISKQKFWIDSTTPESDLAGQLYIPPAIGDFDNDGMDDIAIFTLDGRIRTFKGTSTAGNHKMTIWEFIPEDWEKFIANPVLADLNKDGILDIILVGVNHGLYVLNGASGKILWRSQYNGENSPKSTPVIADIDQDSYLDVLVIRNDNSIYLYASNSKYPAGMVLWEQRFGNAKNNCYAQAVLFTTTSLTFQIIISLILIIVIIVFNLISFKKQNAVTRTDKIVNSAEE
ncbi:VCBS repeat-containing protein, partial [candidate division KSB1 bacterium]|nr:VCBS repeat-containing protein [candidate division KSB1 bacterium]